MPAMIKRMFSPRNVCIPSKTVFLIFISTFVFGLVFKVMDQAVDAETHHVSNYTLRSFPMMATLTFSVFLATLVLFYPVAGFIADIYTGRFKVIVAAVVCLWIGSLAAFIVGILHGVSANNTSVETQVWHAQTGIGVIAVLLTLLAISCYGSNIIQFGFDQVQDMPSCYLSMFIHWYYWADSFGELIVIIFAKCTCSHTIQNKVDTVILSTCPLVSTLLLVTTYIAYKRHWFNTNSVRSNPYKLIFKVLLFARKNKRPVRPPSAFVYCDVNSRPSRLNFAKERFGGPFPNSDVEDVKTFFRVLGILVTLLPLFFLEVPVFDILFRSFSHHSGPTSNYYTNCTVEYLILEGGTLMYSAKLLFLPFYIWLMFTVLRNRVPKILIRLGLLGMLYVLAVCSMLAVDVAGHAIAYSKNYTNVTCLFLQSIDPHSMVKEETLNLHWAVLIVPNILAGIAPTLLMATSLEFISAQTPHAMKGLMVGTLFAIRGLSQLLSAILVIPFSLDVWKHDHTVISCGFGYFLLTIFIASIGLVCFTHRACKYQYRVRGEEGFSQSQVEEIFERRLRLQQEYYNRWRPQPVTLDESEEYQQLCADSEPSQYGSM